MMKEGRGSEYSSVVRPCLDKPVVMVVILSFALLADTQAPPVSSYESYVVALDYRLFMQEDRRV